MILNLRLKTVRALLQMTGNDAWTWKRTERTIAIQWELTQKGNADSPIGVYATGNRLTERARAIGYLHPAVLNEVKNIAQLDAAALDQLEFVKLALEVMSQRAQRESQQELHEEFVLVIIEINRAIGLMKRDSWFPSVSDYQKWKTATDAGE